MPESSRTGSPQNVEEVIKKHAVRMANEFNRVARFAEKEEEVRIQGAKLIDEFLDKAAIEVRARHDYGLAGGSIDSKYGGVIIEYKNPKGNDRIETNPDFSGTRAVIKQIKDRFDDFHREENIEPSRLFGVGCDGRNIVFVRHRGGKFDIEDPQPITASSTSRLLRALVSLGARGYSFTPENLTRDFGAQSHVAEKGISDIYQVITETDNPKAITFFHQWKILFGEVCGYDVEGRNEKIRKLADHYHIPDAKPAELLFSVHTYYAIFIKFLAAEIASSFSPLGVSVLKKCVEAASAEALWREVEKLEQGGIWSELGITNFLEGDLFSWYLAAWNERMVEVVRGIVRTLDDYDPTTLSVDPEESRDLLKHLYQHLFPKSVRHDLGEYYTADWLAEHVLDRLGYDGNPDKRLLDPACGSGTFLVLAINRVKAWFEEHRDECMFSEKDLIGKIQRNVIGFDLNPLAVMAARTNYLLAVRDLLRETPSIELPVYLCDSVMTPAEYGTLFEGRALGKAKRLKTSAGELLIPTEIASDRELLGKYADNLERCIRDRYSADEFLDRCRQDGLSLKEEELHSDLYETLRKLDQSNRNGIWARIVKNAFAPLFIGKMDYVVGNPPWVNWESLPEDYRDDLKPLWQRYGLFTLSGSAGRLGGGKKDLSMLFVYASVDKFLRDGGRLGFLITQSVFKTKGAGDGFRRFRFEDGDKTIYLKPLSVDDFSAIQVFEGATNRTAVFVCERQRKRFDYPVTYHSWRGRSRIDQSEPLQDVKARTSCVKLGAIPVHPGKGSSPWLTAPKDALRGIQKAIGRSPYSAKAGCTTWLNGVFWIRVIDRLADGLLLIENIHDVGRISVEQVQTVIESGLVYPLLRGRDVSSWHAEPSTFVLLTQDPKTRSGIPEVKMKRKFRKTFSYLKRFESQLRQRSGYKKYFEATDPFYSIYNVGPYTLADHKVVWRDMGDTIQAAVLAKGDQGAICPEHHVMFVSVPSEQEAHYICGALMSSPVKLVVGSYTTTTGISTHVLETVNLPGFRPKELVHRTLADLSRELHLATKLGELDRVESLEHELDKAAAELWRITDQELVTIRQGLKVIERVSA